MIGLGQVRLTPKILYRVLLLSPTKITFHPYLQGKGPSCTHLKFLTPTLFSLNPSWHSPPPGVFLFILLQNLDFVTYFHKAHNEIPLIVLAKPTTFWLLKFFLFCYYF